MGYIEIDKDVVARIRIQHVYKPIGYGGRMQVTNPMAQDSLLIATILADMVEEIKDDLKFTVMEKLLP